MKTRDNFLIFHGEWYHLPFAEFAFSDEAIAIKEGLAQRRYKVSDTGETYRVINNWDSSGLLFENEERENGWRKFSLTEYVWICVLRELRSMGFGVDTLKKLRDNLFIKNIKGAETFDTIEMAFFIALIMNKNDVILVADKNGRGSLCLTSDYLRTQIIHPLPTAYAIVNINKILADVTKREKYAERNTHFTVLDSKDIEMKSKMLFEDVNEINIKVKDGMINRINYKSHKVEPKEAIPEVRELLKDKKRKTITIHQDEGGKITSIVKEEKT